MSTTVILYTLTATSAHQINAPILAQRGDEWWSINGHTVRRITAPHPEMIDPINERLMLPGHAARLKAMLPGEDV